MIAHLKAIEAALETATGKAVHIGAAPGAQSFPYVIISGPGWDSPEEHGLGGPRDDLDADVRVKAVGVTPADVYKILGIVRQALSPGKEWAPLAVAGRSAQTRFLRSEFVAEDPSVTLTGTSTHPTQGVDTYRLHSQPLS